MIRVAPNPPTLMDLGSSSLNIIIFRLEHAYCYDHPVNEIVETTCIRGKHTNAFGNTDNDDHIISLVGCVQPPCMSCCVGLDGGPLNIELLFSVHISFPLDDISRGAGSV